MIAHLPEGNYRYLAAPGQPFSSGIVADEGFDLVRAIFRNPVPLEEGLAAARRHVESQGRPATAIGGFELRIIESFTQDGFDTFNRAYVQRLEAMGIRATDDRPAARTNVAPTRKIVNEPSVYAFTYTVPGRPPTTSFRLSGSAETRTDGSDMERLQSVLDTLDTRLRELRVAWERATATSYYSNFGPSGEIEAAIVDRIGRAGLHGMTWFPSSPPIQGLKFELDVRSIGTELSL
jgi:hypothetical protein